MSNCHDPQFRPEPAPSPALESLVELGLYATLLLFATKSVGSTLEKGAEALDDLLTERGAPSSPAEVRAFLTEISRRHPPY